MCNITTVNQLYFVVILISQRFLKLNASKINIFHMYVTARVERVCSTCTPSTAACKHVLRSTMTIVSVEVRMSGFAKVRWLWKIPFLSFRVFLACKIYLSYRTSQLYSTALAGKIPSQISMKQKISDNGPRTSSQFSHSYAYKLRIHDSYCMDILRGSSVETS